MSRKKESLKVHFDITLKFVENLPVKDGNVYITWKRGAKGENNGESRHAVVLDKKAVFEELIPLSCTIYKDKKGYEAKNLALTLKEEKGKKGNTLAKTVIDIAEFVGAKDEKRTFSLKPKKSKTPITLVATFKTKETEVHPDDPITETDGGVTETSLSDDEEDASEDFQDDDSHKSKTPKKSDNKRESLASPIAPVSTSSSSATSAEVEDLRNQLDKAKKRSKELATENVDQEEQIEELKKQVEDLKKNATASPSATSPGREAELKKRVKELATENVDLEEQVNDLKTQVNDLKAQLEQQKKADTKSPNGARNAAVDELNKKVQDLQASIAEKDTQIASQKQEIEKLKQSSKDNDKAASEKADLRSRIKELASENVDMEDQINDLKRELESLKKGSSPANNRSNASAEADLKQKIKDLTEENRVKDDKIDEQQAEIEHLSQKQSRSGANQSQVDELTKENKEKTATIAANKQEIEKLKRDLQDAQKKESSNKDKEDKDAEIEKLRDKVERLKLKLDDSDTKVEESRSREGDLQQRIQELEEEKERLESEAAQSRSASSLTKDKDRERDREKERREKERQERDRLEKERQSLEKEAEKEKEKSKKLEKEVKELKDKLRDLESNGAGAKIQVQANSKPAARSSGGADEGEKAITAALYETPATYRDDDGLPLCAVELWDVLSDHNALNNTEFAAKVIDALEKSVMRMPEDMNALFYWLSTATSLLHLLRDQSDGDSDNDRDPIIDGVYKVEDKPDYGASLQENLEWVAFVAYQCLVRVICKKLEPVIVHAIIEEPVDKKTGVQPRLVTRVLDRVLHRSRDHFLYDAVVQQIYCQVFYYTNAHLLNALLKKERLTAGIGFQIKLGISRLDDWLASASSESDERSLLSPASDHLDTLREVANALVVDKSLFADGSATQSIFRSLSLRQLKRILEVYAPDSLSPHPLPSAARDAVSATWYANRPDSLPFLIDEERIIDFQPRL